MMGETICYYIETFISGLFLKPFLLEPITALRNHFFPGLCCLVESLWLRRAEIYNA